VIVLDTHVLLWLDREDPALGPSSRERIRTAWGQGSVAVCSISFWEVAMLAARGRVELRQSPESWRGDWLRAGLEEIALNGALAVAATAMGRAATLISADQAMLRWPGPLRCLRSPIVRHRIKISYQNSEAMDHVGLQIKPRVKVLRNTQEAGWLIGQIFKTFHKVGIELCACAISSIRLRNQWASGPPPFRQA
jgi:PIN domain nuclease of toxin-antitoxin system